MATKATAKQPEDHLEKDEKKVPKRGDVLEVEKGLEVTLRSDLNDGRVRRRVIKMTKMANILGAMTEEEKEEYNKEHPKVAMEMIVNPQAEIMTLILGEDQIEKAEEFYAEQNDGYCPPDKMDELMALLLGGDTGKE